MGAIVGGDPVADERRYRRPLDRAQVVDHALRVALLRARLGEVARVELGDGEPAVVVASHLGQAAGEQRQLSVRHALIHAAVDLVHVDARLDQVGGHQMSTRAGVLVHEAAGVGDQPDVERLGDVDGRLHAQAVHQVPHDFGRAGRLGEDVVDRAELGVVVVVVDVDDAQSRPIGLPPTRLAERLGRIALEVAAVEEHDRPLLEVVGWRLDQPG